MSSRLSTSLSLNSAPLGARLEDMVQVQEEGEGIVFLISIDRPGDYKKKYFSFVYLCMVYTFDFAGGTTC